MAAIFVTDTNDHEDSNIIGVLARVFVDDLEAAAPIYRELAGGQEPVRFGFREVDLARVGPFLLLSGNNSAYRDRVATVLVRSLDPVLAALAAHGGQVVDDPLLGPNGRRLVARHADGSVFEYIEWREPKADPES
jgi:hypothetical protein